MMKKLKSKNGVNESEIAFKQSIKSGEKFFYADYVYGTSLNWPTIMKTTVVKKRWHSSEISSVLVPDKESIPEFTMSSKIEIPIILEYIDEGEYAGNFMSVLTGEIVLCSNYICVEDYDGKMDPENIIGSNSNIANLIKLLPTQPKVTSYPWLKYVKDSYDLLRSHPMSVQIDDLRPLASLTMAEKMEILDREKQPRDQRQQEFFEARERCQAEIASGIDVYNEISSLCEENKNQDVTSEFDDFCEKLSKRAKILQRTIYKK